MAPDLRLLVLRFAVIGVSVNAFLGIITFLDADPFGPADVQVLLTAVAFSLCSIGLMPPIQAWSKVRIEGLPVIPGAAAAATVSATLLGIIILWSEEDGDGAVNALASLVILAIGLSHLCLLGLARPTAPGLAAMGLTALLGAQLLIGVWTDVEPEWRLLGVTTILLLSTSVLVPVLQWASRGSTRLTPLAVRFCPFCGSELGEGVSTHCNSCGGSFHVTAAT
ncbi:MAG: hypothetical protein AB7P33_00275 [Dehalococcoidia bacterium]